jgi:hypothetical protein
MQVRALADFQSKYGRVRRGQIFSAEPFYAEEQIRLGHIEKIDEKQPAKELPPPPPQGKAPTLAAPPTEQSPTAPQSPTEPIGNDGPVRPSSASLRARRSRKRT